MDKLNPEHLPLLFDEPLYVLNEPGQPAAGSQATSPAISFKGGNKQGILLVNEDSEQLISPADEEFIFKGLNKLGITLADVAIVHPDNLKDLAIPYSKKIVFQKHPPTATLYKVSTQDEVSRLLCHPLAVIRQNHNLKVKLWLGLQELFGRQQASI